MSDDEPAVVGAVERSLAEETARTFEKRVTAQAAWLRAAIADGRMDNADPAVGLEAELYAIAGGGDRTEGEGPRLARVPTAVFGAANKELGVHNVEINTDPNVLDGPGLTAQAEEIRERARTAAAAAEEHGCELAWDAMWTLPPPEGPLEYLSATERRDGVVVAENMRQEPRYVAIDNDVLGHADGERIELSVPGVDRAFPTILFESLATSIQPHLQVPSAEAFPAYHNAAIRTLGPVLALSANSPFLPAALYDGVEDPGGLVDRTHHELRIAVFEQSVNHTAAPKVRVPRDVETAAEVVDRVLEDDRYAPFLREHVEGDTARRTLSDRVWEFDHKRGTYWRWVRGVLGGDDIDAENDEHSIRIEYRPIPTQPTVTDVVGMQALVAGLLVGVVRAEHPIGELPWEAAESSFYNAAREGLDAELAWVTADGERTADPAVVFGEVFEYARAGLDAVGVPESDTQQYLSPIEARWRAQTTPSAWKKAAVRDRLEEGADLESAIAGMQREYVRRSRESGSFAEWL
ncbi:hypothetical protein [Natronomonas sp.]|uniref:hypothetical protein n=1 Tax=Natronomonas sp. TaxID=2184060 RepID=UPI0026318FA7|nr:hypothetical protein [Natronomonas sp.]